MKAEKQNVVIVNKTALDSLCIESRWIDSRSSLRFGQLFRVLQML